MYDVGPIFMVQINSDKLRHVVSQMKAEVFYWEEDWFLLEGIKKQNFC